MHVLILGANSDIAEALAAEFARNDSASLYLASRDVEQLERKARNLEIRWGVKVRILPFDALDYGSHKGFYESLDPRPDGVVTAFGILGDQERAQGDFPHAREIVESNYLGAVSILEIVAADFEKRGHGWIAGIGSVAGDRGRGSNYIYGSAKGALAIYLGGLRNRLCKRGVHVMTVLPGFVRTKMTRGLPLPERLVAEPEAVARDIHRGLKARRNILYTRWFWRWIMLVIRSVPEALFKRTRL